uniref:(northern house mosquito) hypothetical protein n=1 Tax=Culex pipiens TaxID=7175 RepID=A0A8D8BZV3_CULPI
MSHLQGGTVPTGWQEHWPPVLRHPAGDGQVRRISRATADPSAGPLPQGPAEIQARPQTVSTGSARTLGKARGGNRHSSFRERRSMGSSNGEENGHASCLLVSHQAGACRTSQGSN